MNSLLTNLVINYDLFLKMTIFRVIEFHAPNRYTLLQKVFHQKKLGVSFARFLYFLFYVRLYLVSMLHKI